MPSQQDWVNFALQRPNYFPGQYLLDEDFELAHRYLSDRQRYVNSRLHLAGIVEGLQVEAIAGQPEVVIKSGTAIDGEGNLVILPEDVTRKINGLGWLCLRYHQEPKILQQPEIPDSFTRFEETPLLTLEAIHTEDAKTINLAKVMLEDGQVVIDSTVRQYSGVRLPSATEAMALRSDGQNLSIQGNLSVAGALQLGDTLIEKVSQSIPAIDRSNVIPSEKAVKDHIAAALANVGKPTGEAPPVRLDQKDGKMVGWKIKGSEDETDPTALLRLIASEDGVEEPRLTVERDTGMVIVHETMRVQHFELINPMRHRMYPSNPIVYQDIFEARDAGAIAKYGRVKNYDETRHDKDLWFQRRLIMFGEKESGNAGAVVTVPEGYDTIWVRITGDQWYNINAKFLDGYKDELGYWSGGFRRGNSYCPDGSLSDGYQNAHQWLPISVGRSGRVLLADELGGPSTGGLWFGGLGFSKNPWSHATQSGQGYYWANNTGDKTGWHNDKTKGEIWGNDILAIVPSGTKQTLKVPYAWSGRDKLLYAVAHNDPAWNSAIHNGITVNGQPIERFLASYDNPFARHWNSKSDARYLAARIPADLIPEPNSEYAPLLDVQIDMSLQDAGFHFREMGTHDLELPYFL